jgi:hypothetical protein
MIPTSAKKSHGEKIETAFASNGAFFVFNLFRDISLKLTTMVTHPAAAKLPTKAEKDY